MADNSQGDFHGANKAVLERLDDLDAKLSRGERPEPEEVRWLVRTLRQALDDLRAETTAIPDVPNPKGKQSGPPRSESATSSSFSGNVEIFSDGACRGNPGPGGWAAILRCEDREEELVGSERHTTNNRMELMAVIEAFKKLRKPARVVVYTDSQYLQKGMTSWIHSWKKKGWTTSTRQPVKNADLWRALDELTTKHQVKWEWVAGHSGHPENERCDALAREALELGT
jgi:ribonuclease HI